MFAYFVYPWFYLLILPCFIKMITMKLYGIPNCNTVKKARVWLAENGHEVNFHDFKKAGVTEELLKAWFNKFGWEKVINKAGLTFKKLTKEEQEKIDSAEATMNYLLNNTSAIKRPILEVENQPVLIGFKEDDYVACLPK